MGSSRRPSVLRFFRVGVLLAIVATPAGPARAASIGTVQVPDINAGFMSSNPTNLTGRQRGAVLLGE